MQVLAALSVALGLLVGTTPTGPAYLCSAEGTVQATCCCADTASGACCGEGEPSPPCGPRDAVEEGPCCVLVPSSARVDPVAAAAGDAPVLPAAVSDGFIVGDVVPAPPASSLRRTVGATYRGPPLYVLHESFLI